MDRIGPTHILFNVQSTLSGWLTMLTCTMYIYSNRPSALGMSESDIVGPTHGLGVVAFVVIVLIVVVLIVFSWLSFSWLSISLLLLL